MQLFSSNETQGFSILKVVDSNHLLTGHQDGHITLWQITDNNGIYDFYCTRTFIHHSKETYCFAILNNNLFVSASKDGTYGVWNLDSEDYIRVLNPVEWQVSPQNFYCNMVGLPTDDLVAIAGYNYGSHPRHGGLDIWDAVSGECIYPNVDNFWYPEGIEVAVAKGFLIAYSHCRGGYVYKVDRDSCIKLFELDDHRIYCMAVSPIGEIMLANHDFYVYKLGTDGTYSKEVKKVEFRNVICRIISINSYKAVLITSVGAVFVLDYLSDINHSIRFERTRSGELPKCCCYLPLSDVLVGITENTICVQHFPKMVQLPRWIIELRMLTMLFSQAVRTGNEYLSETPWDVLEEILALTAPPGIAYSMALKVVSDHMGWPRRRNN